MKNKTKLKKKIAPLTHVALDANEQLYGARALEAVKAKIYKVEYPETKARSMIPASETKGQWVKRITYRQYDKVGTAKVISNMADDLPIINIRGKEFSVDVKMLGDAYTYTIQDIAEAAHANLPLLTQDAEGVREAMEQLIEKLAWYGDAKSGIPGLLYNPNITAGYAAAGASGSTKWADKTNDEIVLDMTHALTDPEDLTNNVEQGLDVLALPTAQYNLIKQRRMASGTDTTILQFFLENNPGVEVVKLIWLKSMPTIPSTGGVGGTGFDCMLAYKKDASKLTLEIPFDFYQLPPEPRNLAYIVNCIMNFAGVIVYRPLSVNLVEGI